jgi:hypothetical protein
MERRIGCRHRTHMPILYSSFPSHASDETLDGEMEDYSDCGMNAVLRNKIAKGTNLLVRAINNELDSYGHDYTYGFRSLTLAEVKWSKAINADGKECYVTGLRHLSLM